MAQRNPIVVGEWYHCYNRGVDKRIIFETYNDYERFMLLLYLCNGSEQVHISNFKTWSFEMFLTNPTIDRGERLVEIGVYALMPNHFHLILQEIKPGGIATFLQRVCTGYTMYFNIKQERTGSLFSGPFKSKHILDDAYLTLAVPYVLLNPAELFDSNWKNGTAFRARVKQELLKYRYSSLQDFIGIERPENTIIGSSLSTYFETIPSLDKMLINAQEYYLQATSTLENIKARP